jgi:Fe-S-cluster containining protein
MVNKISYTFWNKYTSLRTEADKLCLKLELEHRDNIACVCGCCHCCMDFSIFPVEFHSIVKEAKEKDIIIDNKTTEGACPFLVNGHCSIYGSRPLICRTHGLPLLYMSEDEWQMSWCELNFTGNNIPAFDESNTFPQDRFNSRLFMLNREFVNSLKGKPYSDTDLISLRELGDSIRNNGIKA